MVSSDQESTEPVTTSPKPEQASGKSPGPSTAIPDEKRRIPTNLGSERAARASDANDDDAIKEAKQLSEGKSAEQIATEAAQNEHERNEKFRNHFEKMAVVGLWIAFVVLVLMVMSWVSHILLPAKCHWLTSEQLAKVQNLVTGGVVASLAVGHLRKRIGHH